MSPTKKRTAQRSPALQAPSIYEAEVAEGLEEIAASEAQAKYGRAIVGRIDVLPQAIRFLLRGEPTRLRTVQSVYHVQRFDVPRPKALLGDQYFRIIISNIDRVVTSDAKASFRSFNIHAAGSDSSIMRRIREEIGAQTKFTYDNQGGDLILRIRPARGDGGGWEVLTRITPRPLATRDWRVCNLEGALNAPIAHAMNVLTAPDADQTYVNLACGSGTFLIERLAFGPAARVIGVDDDPSALECAARNIAASRVKQRIDLLRAKVGAVPLPDHCADALSADLPFGNLVGSHDANLSLYPALLGEAARIARRGALMVLLTHEVRLMDRLLEGRTDWVAGQVIRTGQRGLHPRIYLLERQ